MSFDANGNLLSDGQRNYSWDAENRLVGISYPGQSGKQTAFNYDGLSRRTAIASTPAGGSATTTNYLWCGSSICQARDTSNSPIRSYYVEGEFVPGTPAQPYYYGPDQIGSVRRVFASASSAPAFSYDPYGQALQTTTPLTDFDYAGMFYNADSGLYLTKYRAYDSVSGRWSSRDPAGERNYDDANLYAYVQGNPVNLNDPLGLCTVNIGISGSINIPIIGSIGFGGSGFGGIVYDGTNWAWYYGGGGGIGGGAGGSIGLQFGGSNANSVFDLRGPFLSASVTGGEGIVGGGEAYLGSSNGVTVGGGNVFIGVGAGTPVSGTGGVTVTRINAW